MEVTPDQVINGLLEEVKRLTIENVALKAALNQLTAQEEAPKEPTITEIPADREAVVFGC